MLIGRTGNGVLLRKTGVRSSLIIQGITATIGGVLVLLDGPIAIAILGSFIAGLGLAGAGPTALSVSGLAMPDRAAAAAGIALAGGYLGLIVSPIMGGLLAGAFNTRVTMVIVALAGLALVATASRLPAILAHTPVNDSASSLAS
jgi:MFS family permease